MNILLSLDLSTSCVGWSVFNMDTEELVTYGTLRPKFPGMSKMIYPRQQLMKMIDLSYKIKSVIDNFKPTKIVIEEIAGSRQRLGQKVLDGLHWILLYHIQDLLDIIEFYDVTGNNSWRYDLGMKLGEQDKIYNKEAKKLNKQIGNTTKIHVYNWKDLSCRYANATYGLGLDPIQNDTDGDIGDSVAMGSAYLKVKRRKNVQKEPC